MLLSACQTTGATSLPLEAYTCASAPAKPGDNATQKDYAEYTVNLWWAWADCANALERVGNGPLDKKTP